MRFDRIPAKMRLRRRLLILIRCQMRSVAGCYRFQPTERYEFAAAAKDAVLWCGSLNFFILLTSSLTIVLAINAAAQDERPNRMIRWLVVTLVLGAAFLGVKGYEYYLDFQDKVVPILDSEVKLGDGSAGSCSGSSTGSQRLSLSQTPSGWRLIENRAMLLLDVRFVQTDLWNGDRSAAVASCA